MHINITRWKELSEEQRRRILARSGSDIEDIKPAVKTIIDDVAKRGDVALRELSHRYDHADLTDRPLRVQPEEIAQARGGLDAELRLAIETAVDNAMEFHRRQRPEPWVNYHTTGGMLLGERWTSIDSVGLYVPRGRGSFPSMFYMLAAPAIAAEVPRTVVVTPPMPDGSVDAACLYAAELLEIEEIYRVGGAQAIAALALGTDSIAPVIKILGPGSRYVAAAKQLLSSVVDTGSPAGPTESVILADDSTDSFTCALDLMIEAEHGSDSSALLITPSDSLAEEVAAHLMEMVPKAPEPRRGFLEDVFAGYGGILLCDSLAEGVEIVNRYAPEHLQLRVSEPYATIQEIRNAGEVLIGRFTPFSIANYATGANSVLPTGGGARTYSPVSVRDFMKVTSVIHLQEEGYHRLEDHVIRLSDYEGFWSHAWALRRRKNPDPSQEHLGS
ncbi:MAG: histidinol dehydrogenase [Spirochaetaceae bacterium]